MPRTPYRLWKQSHGNVGSLARLPLGLLLLNPGSIQVAVGKSISPVPSPPSQPRCLLPAAAQAAPASRVLCAACCTSRPPPIIRTVPKDRCDDEAWKLARLPSRLRERLAGAKFASPDSSAHRDRLLLPPGEDTRSPTALGVPLAGGDHLANVNKWPKSPGPRRLVPLSPLTLPSARQPMVGVDVRSPYSVQCWDTVVLDKKKKSGRFLVSNRVRLRPLPRVDASTKKNLVEKGQGPSRQETGHHATITHTPRPVP